MMLFLLLEPAFPAQYIGSSSSMGCDIISDKPSLRGLLHSYYIVGGNYYGTTYGSLRQAS
jgi:hypothetical protein